MKVKDKEIEMIIKFLKDEYWYGGAVDDGYRFPLSENDEYEFDLMRVKTYNQFNPFFCSSKGRFIWIEKGELIKFVKGTIYVYAENYFFDDTSTNLKQAFLKGSKMFFPPSGKKMPDVLFKSQYCTWIEYFYDQNQDNILSYARNLVKKGMPAGIFIIDDGWQADYGDWRFNTVKFKDPESMFSELTELGFTPMLWICPYISPDSENFRYLERENLLLKDNDGNIKIVHWWNGYSAALDLYNPAAVAWLNKQIERLKNEFNVTAFKMDGGDSSYIDNVADPNGYTEKWAKSIESDIKQMRACYKCGGQSLSQSLCDKSHVWGVNYGSETVLPDGGNVKFGLTTLIPNILNAGITGYYFTLPDMVGGGQISDFLDKTKLDNELLIRSCQCSCLMPFVQFSLSLWNIDNDGVSKITSECVSVRKKYLTYIKELAAHAAIDGEPIVRYMEYEFPNQNMEKVVSQFMLGDKILVAPVLEKNAKTKKVYLPSGKWQDVNGKVYSGQSTVVFDVDINSLPIFLRI